MLTEFTTSIKQFIVVDLSLTTSTNLLTMATTIHRSNRVTALSIPTEPAEANFQTMDSFTGMGRVDQTHWPFLRHALCMEQMGLQHLGDMSHAFILLQMNGCQNEIETRYFHNYSKSKFLNK